MSQKRDQTIRRYVAPESDWYDLRFVTIESNIDRYGKIIDKTQGQYTIEHRYSGGFHEGVGCSAKIALELIRHGTLGRDEECRFKLMRKLSEQDLNAVGITVVG